ncbi:hypothetical protein GCM10010381_32710 [Streptomyces xantholiticus]|nr:hypothetical protein GCM10010381_32710 [Streptomyces xantholiticus]
MALFLRHDTDKTRRPTPLAAGVSAPRATVHGRPGGTVSQSGYPQGVWTKDQMLWRTLRNLCTDRGTALWKSFRGSNNTPPELLFQHPPPVGEKNFPSRTKIRTNGTRTSGPGTPQ